MNQSWPRSMMPCGSSGGRFKNTYELLNLRALKFSPVNKIHIFQCMGKIFCVEFQRYPLKFTQNIFPIHWKIWFLYNIEILRALRFKSSYVFLKCPPGLHWVHNQVHLLSLSLQNPVDYLNLAKSIRKLVDVFGQSRLVRFHCCSKSAHTPMCKCSLVSSEGNLTLACSANASKFWYWVSRQVVLIIG